MGTLKGVRTSIKQWLKSAENEAKTLKNSKVSPMRTRLRSLSASTKKSPLKKVQILKSPSSPELALGAASHQVRPLSKQTRKNISPKHSQSVPGKLNRQNSRSSSVKAPESSKKKRIGSGKKSKASQKKVLQKAAWKSLEDPLSSESVVMSN